MKLREVLSYLTVEDAQMAGIKIEAAIVVPFFGEKLVLGYNRWRGGWEFPGGVVEWREPVRAAAGRELLEETGAEYSSLEFVKVLWLERGAYRSFKAALYFAEVSRLGRHFDFHEIDEVDLFDQLPARHLLSFECEDELFQLAREARERKKDK